MDVTCESLPRAAEKDKLIDDIFSLGTIDSDHGQISVHRKNVV